MAAWGPYLDTAYDPLMAGSIDGTDKEPHDRGIVRALQAKYKPNKMVQGDPSLTIFVARLSPKTKEQTLCDTFSHFGKIRHCRLIRDIVTGLSKCYGFIEFESEKAMQQALSEGKKITIDNKEILVDNEHERMLKNWVPRRLGGGFGGRKESGQLRFGGIDRPFRRPIVATSKLRPGTSDNRSNSLEESQKCQDTNTTCRDSRHDYGRQKRDDFPGNSRSGYSGSSNYDGARGRRHRSRLPHAHDSYKSKTK